MNTQQATAIFFEESREQCNVLDTFLLAMRKQEPNDETLAAMFRTAHTIKGSAGLFSFDNIVRFTHAMEHVLDTLRKHEVKVDPHLLDLLLKSNDYLRLMLQTHEVNDSAEMAIDAHGEALIEQLLGAGKHAHGNSKTTATTPAASVSTGQQQTQTTENQPAQVPNEKTWYLFLHYHADLFRMGFDPKTFLDYLSDMGQLQAVFTHFNTPDKFAEFDPTSCQMWQEIIFQTEQTEQKIRATFDFIIDDSRIEILRSDAPDAAFRALAQSLAESLAQSSANPSENSNAEHHLARWKQQGMYHPHTQESVVSPVSDVQQQQSQHPQASPVAVPVPPPAPPAPPPYNGPERRSKDRLERHEPTRFIRVEAGKLDALINRVGELVIAAASSRMRARITADSDMVQAAEVLSVLVEGIRDDALTLRMVPINEIFSLFPRMVHDVSQRLGKDIDLQIVGAETEIDKSMVERLTDPLMHIVRNAIDHGIEASAARTAAGKPEQGKITLKAYHDTGSVVVDVIDDGAGINLEKVLKRATAQGLIDSSRHLNEQEIINLIFLPGFSTAEQVSDISGRGVGMDVVKRNIEALRGETTIHSETGKGSTMRIRLPLTLAIIDGFHVEVNGSSLVLPLDTMSECLELPEVVFSNDTKQINLRGVWIPYVSLRELFAQPASTEAQFVVIVQFGQMTAGIVVDRLIGDIQAVIKPLGSLFGSLPGISGSTIMANGRLALILDIPQIIQLALKREQRTVRSRSQPANPLAQSHQHVTYSTLPS